MYRFTKTEIHALWAWVKNSPWAEFLIGGLVCALAAVVSGALAAGHTWEAWIPLCFSTVLLLTAVIFGMYAGLLGSVLAALVFAVFLFSPTGRMNVADQTARTNLGWMTVTGIAFSFLFGPSRSRFPTAEARRSGTTENEREAS